MAKQADLVSCLAQCVLELRPLAACHHVCHGCHHNTTSLLRGRRECPAQQLELQAPKHAVLCISGAQALALKNQCMIANSLLSAEEMGLVMRKAAAD